jgi:hypothetical protein
MNVDLNNDGEQNEWTSDFVGNLIFGLLAFAGTFAILRWVF